ncbi:hypothetical protein IRJ41_021015, partial [Triplophysa rosa]
TEECALRSLGGRDNKTVFILHLQLDASRLITQILPLVEEHCDVCCAVLGNGARPPLFIRSNDSTSFCKKSSRTPEISSSLHAFLSAWTGIQG